MAIKDKLQKAKKSIKKSKDQLLGLVKENAPEKKILKKVNEVQLKEKKKKKLKKKLKKKVTAKTKVKSTPTKTSKKKPVNKVAKATTETPKPVQASVGKQVKSAASKNTRAKAVSKRKKELAAANTEIAVAPTATNLVKSTAMSAKEAISKLMSLADGDKIKEFIAGEKRVTVINKAKMRLKTFIK